MSSSDRPRLDRSTLGVNLLLALGALLIALLALELGLRLFRPPPTFKPVVPAEVYRFDPLLGWSLTPNAHVVSQHPDLPITYHTTADGLREERDYPRQRQPGVARIIVLGDSRTFGYGVAAEDRFSEVLERRLRATEVINMGVSAYGIDQELLLLRQQGIHYQPDLVLVYVAHFGDSRHMHAERFGRAKPLFLLDQAGALVLTNTPLPDPGPDNLHEWLQAHSRAYNFFALRIGWLLRGRQSPAELGDDQPEDQFSPAAVNRVAGALLVEMAQTAEQAGGRLALISGVPWLHQFALQQGIPSLDVAGLVDDPAFWLTATDSHPNAAGNARLAGAIYDFLRQRQLLPAEHFAPP